MLSDDHVESFVADGYVHVENAFARADADAARAILWAATGKDPDDPATWDEPVVRLGFFDDPPFRRAITSPRLHAVFDQLAGPGRWLPRSDVGTVPVRFPHPRDPGDLGWHLDAGWHPALARAVRDGTEWPDLGELDRTEWRTDVFSTGRAFLLLMLFSDVGDADAPTRLRAGSHLDVAAVLAPFGAAGSTLTGARQTEHRPVVTATGRAGDAYVCHPFLVHAAQRHRGTAARFVAQPAVHSPAPLALRPEPDVPPVERAVLRGLGRDA